MKISWRSLVQKKIPTPRRCSHNDWFLRQNRVSNQFLHVECCVFFVHTRIAATNPGLSLPFVEVKKKDGQLMMTGKAYNNRVICEWLHDVLAWALLTQGCPLHIWWWHLAENSWAQKKLWDTPYVDRLDHKMQEKSLSTDDPENEKCFPVWFQQPVTKPRNGMARFFGIMERCPRFLSLDWSHACMHFFRVLEILIADGTPRKVLFLQYCHEIWSISDYYIHARCFGSSMTTFHAKYLFFAAWHEVSWASGSPG